MHNIETLDQANGRGTDPRTPGVGKGTASPVLTVTDGDYDRGGATVRILFRGSVFSSSLMGIVINPWTDSKVAITGEDLFALRELLNEMPEEAFVRPADPVVALPRWADGDVVRNDTSGYLYERKNGWWWNRTEGSHNAIPDIDMSNAVDDFPDANIVLRQANA